MTKDLMRSVCVGAILAATGISAASAQQTIAPASATPATEKAGERQLADVPPHL